MMSDEIWQIVIILLTIGSIVATTVMFLSLYRSKSTEPDVMVKTQTVLSSQERRMERMRASMDSLETEHTKLQKERDEERRRMAEMQSNIDTLNWELGELSIEFGVYSDWIDLLFEQLRVAGLEPAAKPKRSRMNDRGKAIDRIAIKGQLVEHYSMDEMKTLAFNIGINPEDFHGNTRDAVSRELIELVFRLGKEKELIKELNKPR